MLKFFKKAALAIEPAHQESYEAIILYPGQNGDSMRKTKMMLLGVLLATASAAWAAPATGIAKYELKEFIADFTQFKIGDNAPAMYLTPEYNIKQWQLRNLPAPDAGTHWTYMGGNYVLIGDTDGKISKIYDGEIFYHR